MAVNPSRMKEVCVRCGERYGDHALIGGWCPSKDRGRLFGNTRFRKSRVKTSSSSTTRGSK